MTINTEVTVGDILTIAALLLTVITILIAWQKDRRLKLKEYASPIRHSAGLIIAKVRRWKVLSLQYFDEIQPILTDADGIVTAKKDVTSARDSLWRNLVASRALYNEKILDEEIEVAFAGLHGYDPKIQDLFTEAVNQLQAVDKAVNNILLQLTQFDVLAASEPSLSAKLGNKLRKSSVLVSQLNERLMDQIVEPFCLEMTKLIKASDTELASKQVKISDPAHLFPKGGYRKINSLFNGLSGQYQQLVEICQRYPIENVPPVELLKFLNRQGDS
jgi:hypothetical protein